MGELPTREQRPPEEKFADSQTMQGYFRSPVKEKPIRHILQNGEWMAVVPGDRDYKRALPDRYDRESGMPISPWDSSYESALKKRP